VQAHVIIATKGRAAQVCELLRWLNLQTVQPASVIVVGVTPDDVEGIAAMPYAAGNVTVLLTHEAGSCLQRNAGIEHLIDACLIDGDRQRFFVTFFDDDYRPAFDWLQRCRDTFIAHDDVVAVTGHVLADGVHGQSLFDEDALAYIGGKREPEKHWASGDTERVMASMYGCNMAFRDVAIRQCRFDENLPLYGWQEDQDYTAQASRFGRTLYTPACRGVHLGSSSGRVSGLRFGYSQIANPLYLSRKGTMGLRKSARFVLRHLLANGAKGVRVHPRVDYRGRLRGNLMAIVDCLRGRCDPRRVLELQ
jgi:GT2 family glycosyltransferase